MKPKITVIPEALKSIEALAQSLPRSESEKIKAAMSLAHALVELDSRDDPIVLVFGKLQITNDRYRVEQENALKSALRAVPNIEKNAIDTVYEALQLKPSFFGFGIDLKPIFEVARKAFQRKS
ncbi:MAG: hypothetical protein EPN57_18330 [Paraburkholderia sp.]|nr:MAG: hypothetical protein EPN57_18330 [Paraburkholderia sp.]